MLHHSRGAARAALIEMTDSIGQGMVPNNLVPTMARLRQEKCTDDYRRKSKKD